MEAGNAIIRLLPYEYVHILDNNSSVTRTLRGPSTYAKADHEKILFAPQPMVVLPPRHYCRIRNPYVRDEKGEPDTDDYGQVKLQHDEIEYRFADEWPAPFPLYPGEVIEEINKKLINELQIVQPDTALRLQAQRNFVDTVDDKEVQREAGDEWLFVGPATYKPRVEESIEELVLAQIILPNCALKLRARRAFRDRRANVDRKAGEQWLVRETGSYLPGVDEQVMGIVNPSVVTQKTALHLRAKQTFTDFYGQERKAGDEWLITLDRTEFHILDVYEELIRTQHITVLQKDQYAIIVDPVSADGKNQYGAKVLRKGPCTFFLQPGERLDNQQHQRKEIKEFYVLGADECVLLKALESFEDIETDKQSADYGKKVTRTPGDLWSVYGACAYVPSVDVEVVEVRKEIPLDETEGIYVRDIKLGSVRSVIGKTYMLKSSEQLFEKELPEDVEELLDWSYYRGMDADKAPAKAPRDKTRVVVFRVPHNAASQVYDYKKKQSRVVFGPGLVMLEPDEQFTVLSLSGDKPKRPDVIKSITCMLGPDFMTDIIEVETSDHARLRLQLSYNWHFDVEQAVEEDETKQDEPVDIGSRVFQVRDFVGDACKALGSRVRGAVAGTTFDLFHKTSAKLIRAAVFGVNEAGQIGHSFIFHANSLVITNVDIQSVEPVDARTRESLMKSVQLAIEITTKKQEREARHSAQEQEASAAAQIELIKLENQKGAEEEKTRLINLQTECAAIESTGQAKAEAEAKADFIDIEAKADVELAKLSVQASNIETSAELEEMVETQKLEVEHSRAMAELELNKSQRLTDIETNKFSSIVSAIGTRTIAAIANAGPEMQARLLKGLGLKGYLLTDGNSPVNLFNAAKGMVGQPAAGANSGVSMSMT